MERYFEDARTRDDARSPMWQLCEIVLWQNGYEKDAGATEYGKFFFLNALHQFGLDSQR